MDHSNKKKQAQVILAKTNSNIWESSSLITKKSILKSIEKIKNKNYIHNDDSYKSEKDYPSVQPTVHTTSIKDIIEYAVRLTVRLEMS